MTYELTHLLDHTHIHHWALLSVVGAGCLSVVFLLFFRFSNNYLKLMRELEEREHKLEENQILRNTFIKHAPFSIAMLDADMRYILVSDQWLRDYRLGGRDNIIGMSHYALFPEIIEHKPEWVALHQRCLSGEIVTAEEDYLPRADGHDMWLRYIWVPWRDGRDAVQGIIMFNEDITTRKLSEQQMREQHKMEALGKMAGGVAHEINNLLQPILMYSKMMQGDIAQIYDDDKAAPKTRDKAAKYLSKIERSAMTAADIVHRTLIFSRKDEHSNEVVDLIAELPEMINYCRDLVPVSVTVETIARTDEEKNFPVIAHKTGLQQIIINLMNNAVDAIDGPGHIEISYIVHELPRGDALRQQLGTQHVLQLTVQDDGPGMSEDVRKRVMEPFFTTKDVGAGTGLGLSVVYGLVAEWGGTIEIESMPEAGSSIHIFLPRASEEAQEDVLRLSA